MSEVNEQKDVEKQKNKVVEFRVTSLIDNIFIIDYANWSLFKNDFKTLFPSASTNRF